MKNIFLCGFMGSGKTTIAKILTRKTNLTFIDTDLKIKNLLNLTINEIFSIYGENYFRKLEHKILEKINKNKNQIVSTGGGLFSKRKNRKLAKKTGVIVFLNCPLEICLKRIKDIKNRPLLKDKNQILKLYLKRQKIYTKIADFIVENTTTANKCADSILKLFNLPTFGFK